MEKRAIIFVVLSLAIIMGFQYLYAPQVPQEQAPQAPQAPHAIEDVREPEPASPPPKVVFTPAAPVSAPAEAQKTDPNAAESIIRVETDTFIAELSSRGGTVRSFFLKDFKDTDGQPLSILNDSGVYRALAVGSDNDFSISNSNFEVQGSDIRLLNEGSTGSVSFTYVGEGFSIHRTYTFSAGTYIFKLTDRVTGLPSYSVTLGADFGINDNEDRYAHIGPVLLVDSDRDEYTARKLKKPKSATGNLKWIALEDKYFFAAMVPDGPMARADVWRYQDSPAISFTARPGEQSFAVYAGPKQRYELMELGIGLEHIVDFGFFSVVAVPIFWLLKQMYAFTGNYGWAIILMTIIIRVPFLPLVQKGQKSMKKMQTVAPKVAEIKKKHKSNPEQMNKEVMALYKKYKVNPLGGCLPLLLQLPVFLALYQVLLKTIELRGAPWLFWVTDLSLKDPFYVLPIIMGGTMYLQQKLTPTAMDPKQAKLMQMLPIVFTFMFLWFPSGLVL